NSGFAGNGDVTGDDLVLQVLDRVGVIDVIAFGGVADAVSFEVEGDRTGLEVTGLERPDGLEDRDIDTFQHGGEHVGLLVVGGGQVLIGVDADDPLVGFGSGLEDAGAGTSGGVVDDIRTVVVEALSGRLAFGGIRESTEVTVGAEVFHFDGDVGVDGFGPGDVAGFELLDERVFDATHVADGAGFGGLGGDGTDQE